MKRRLRDLVIMSDIDGTLITRQQIMPPRNREALERFVAKGGRFGLSTGRVPVNLDDMLGPLPINFPCVMYNGGMIFDYNEKIILKDWTLPDYVAPYFRQIEAAVPSCESVVVSDDYYIIRENTSFLGRYQDKARLYLQETDLDKIPRPWRKGLFFIDEEYYDDFYKYVSSHDFPGVRFVATNYILQEMLPEACSKAMALEKLMKMENVPMENLICIGDFYNDLEMIQLAGMGVTLKDSPKELLDVADLVVGLCEDGALADLVEHLENICEE